jgi:hypothetical protein
MILLRDIFLQMAFQGVYIKLSMAAFWITQPATSDPQNRMSEIEPTPPPFPSFGEMRNNTPQEVESKRGMTEFYSRHCPSEARLYRQCWGSGMISSRIRLTLHSGSRPKQIEDSLNTEQTTIYCMQTTVDDLPGRLTNSTIVDPNPTESESFDRIRIRIRKKFRFE